MRRIKKEDLEGAVNVEGDITPITRKPIEQVDASEWHKLSVAELATQRATLQQRLTMAHKFSPHLVTPIQRGIAMLDRIIKSKQNEDVGLI